VLKNRYRDLMNKEAIDLLRRYKIDYVLLGKNDHLFNTIENRYTHLIRVYDDGNYKIYKFNKI